MGKKIYVGNLPYTISNDDLASAFADFGNVESAKIITDRDTGRSKGFGFVEMSSDDEAASAIEALNGKDFNGRNLTVNEAKPQAPRDNNRGGGHRGGPRGGNRF
ncbi:hypothetical protein M899_0646 [Bacteriovorax sp. BSW11_IV]|uniref:RNA recognition motif domain-containing protein n=1 Tax=Bacteriovorax sp. BSW11_IV TaxID=1353529 RepID=UPI00038A4120|nr:RNA-binding protein [Bacteriovorax sp. BSW11_IV]EQC49013.1 hypothetical protein M899_0646 [Bacteriovorax sp. BSW11_IV]